MVALVTAHIIMYVCDSPGLVLEGDLPCLHCILRLSYANCVVVFWSGEIL